MKIMGKYTTNKISSIITSIGFSEKRPGGQYFESVLFSNLPTDEEMEDWDDKTTKEWIKRNNDRMESICKFLNGKI